MSPATVVGLQRHAGNSAVTRVLQRCSGGGCTCRGTCGGGSRSTLGREDEFDELEGGRISRQFAGAVAARSM